VKEFDWERGTTLTKSDFEIKDKVVLVDKFLYTGTVTLIYSPAKQGKTWFGYALANKISENDSVKKIFIIDMDNNIQTLKDRKVDELLLENPKIKYTDRARIECDPIEHLEKIAKYAHKSIYEGIVFFLETTKDFVRDVDNHNQSNDFIKMTLRIRDAGGTVILFHHTTKSGRQISGASVWTNSPDNVYELSQKRRTEGVIHQMLIPRNCRYLSQEKGFSIYLQELLLKPLDPIIAGMSREDELFVNKVKETLQKHPEGINQSALFGEIGYKKTDKTARNHLEKFTGDFWHIENGKNNQKIYKL